MAQQSLFDQGGINVVTTTDDQIFGTACDPQIFIRILAAQIARTQIDVIIIKVFVFVGLSIGATRTHAWVCDTDFANFIHTTFYHFTVHDFDDFDISVWEIQPDRANLFLTINGVTRHQTCRLGQAIAFNNCYACGFFKAAEQFQRQWRRPRKGCFHGGNIRVHRTLHQGRNRRWNGNHKRDAPAFDQFPEIVKHPIPTIARRCWEHHMRPR